MKLRETTIDMKITGNESAKYSEQEGQLQDFVERERVRVLCRKMSSLIYCWAAIFI